MEKSNGLLMKLLKVLDEFKVKILVFLWLVVLLVGAVYIFIMYLNTSTVSYYSSDFYLKAGDLIGSEEKFGNWVVPFDGTIEKMTLDVEGAPRQNLHHLVLLYGGKRDLMCRKFPERLMGVAKEVTPVVFPKGYGYEIKKGQIFYGEVHFYNPTKKNYKNARLKINITIRRKSIFNLDKSVKPIWYDILNCEQDPTVFIGPHQTEEFSLKPKITIPYDGYIVYANAHFHDFANMLTLYLNRRKILIFKSKSVGNEVDKIPPYVFDGKNKINLRKGQVLDGKVKYANTTDSTVDGMGLDVIYIKAAK